ncbi:hypothetical protein ACFV2H_38490 [Streptomyces sp. NPDC059629]|uniref:hypothetical protein n=1 Tax=Streptomyces sp. NPDC059629 TaxID=3346889 RepID=UPI003684108C
MESAVCDGGGVWRLEKGSGAGERDAVVVRLTSGRGTGGECGDETYWAAAGTDRTPELFVVGGDPDVGDVRILTRVSG